MQGIPEVAAFDGPISKVRIPDQLDVPFTDRVRVIVDSPPFRRLAKVSQTGLVGLVFPGATHTRFEHSLGVLRNASLFLRQLSLQPEFAERVTREGAERFLVAALLHDVGHWPFCHPIEDMRLPGSPRHEALAKERLGDDELCRALRQDWGVEAEDVARLLENRGTSDEERVLQSLLSGPVDVDKMDYLYRDSLHAGVPYGRNFDSQRLIGSLVLDPANSRLAITPKGRTAAEMMVFARYVMFSEVYWHHAVRSATAMLQRLVYALAQVGPLDESLTATDQQFEEQALRGAASLGLAPLAEGLFGSRRRLFKRVGEFSYREGQEVYDAIARRPFAWIVRCSERFQELWEADAGAKLPPAGLLIDAPPQKLEVQFAIDVGSPNRGFRPLAQSAPVVETLAREQFDRYVKKVRIFLHPDYAGTRRPVERWLPLLMRAVEETPA
jgi:HD superfamily phosphohydrolase